LAVSPDGTRLYVLAVNSKRFTEVEGGSAGVLVLDSGTLEVLDNWPPTADLVSIATSADGRFVYASGMSSSDSAGQRTNQPASVTVYDRESGRLVAFLGQLGEDWVMFDPPPR
jgi:DNA-binding beta-propeller fold protein YncE